ncbi:hypothetical protein QLS71_016375 [Mariniflexile litorale]|uniref:Cytochrome c domain-containing protein n=1 Tax=Mariniflexile litorale TaxID=3045158 RepID=A0AAU7EEL5_9FLAO|nr:hypothetical protein [Mariniflexile sp. KMM 9835]MDQ8212278.1 hypothetical protein [Mariniflexile sp. KMM 9835]
MKLNKLMLFASTIIKTLALCIVLLSWSCNQNKTSEYVALEAPAQFSSSIPVDVDPALQKALIDAGDIYQLNEMYNIYSWQALIAINWPLDANGIPLKNFTDAGSPAWLKWKEAFQVYRADGKQPAAWNSPRKDTGLGLNPSILNDSDSRILLITNTPAHNVNNIADETDQAFAGKLFDQNGNVVVYEVLMNKEEFDYVVENKLYNINGQIEFSKTNTEANFPKGNFEKQELGATEIKLAWKILENSDIKERYFKDKGYIINEIIKKPELVDIGLIGFHISQKTPTGKQWVWSTFEHIDNLDQNITNVGGQNKVIHPTLTNPDCEICPVNVDVTNGGSKYSSHITEHGNYWNITRDTLNYYTDDTKLMKTQSKRMIDIPVRVKQINNMMQNYFKQQGSVWQYYQLIDTQYPLNQNAKPGISTATEYHLPESVINKPGGKPNLIFLTNISMETFFQGGNQIAGLMENSTSNMTIFGTESCMGCHSSANLINNYTITKQGVVENINGDQLSGDFSWLLNKASWEKGVPKPAPKKE